MLRRGATRDMAAAAGEQRAAEPADERGWRALGTPISCERGGALFIEGDPADKIYQVLLGAVRISKLLSDGRRQIAGFYLPGEFFALETGDQHRFTAEAIVASRIAVFSKAAIGVRAKEDASLSSALWRMTGACLGRVEEHLLLLGRKSALERVATFLLDLAARTDSGSEVELLMSRQDIGDFLGLSIETVSRTFSQLERQGAIALPSARNVLLKDRRKLLQLEG